MNKVQYRLNVSYPGLDPSYDRQIERCVKRERDGSGFAFFSNERDIGFTFYVKKAVDAAAKRVRAMRPKKRGTKVTVYVEDDR